MKQGTLIFLSAIMLVVSAAMADSRCSRIEFGGREFDLATPAGLSELDEYVRGWLEAEDRDKKSKRGAGELIRLARAARDETNAIGRERMLFLITEVAAALKNNERAPVPRRVDVVQLPFVHRRYAGAAIGRGRAVARNLADTATVSDLSLLDPQPSTFWRRPTNIAGADLAAGFGRRAVPRFHEKVWSYSGPKTSYGGHAGFEAECDGAEIKIKFGELHSEPFAARIFHALGYNVDPTDWSPGLKVRYDRRLFTEFNSRKALDTRITAFGILPVWTIRFQPVHDPFQFLAGAVLKDGTILEAEEFERALLGGSPAARPASDEPRDGHRVKASWSRDDPAGEFAFDEAFEAKIDYLVTLPANIQLNDKRVRSIGPWDFGQCGHEHLRELRGAGLLAAWLGWFDSRFDNTRLKNVENDGRTELKHYFTDLGGCLGKSSGWFSWRDEDLEAFPRFFTKKSHGRLFKRSTFEIVNHRPIERTPAFREMTIDDARWMARLIAQLTQEQIIEALAATGFDEEKQRHYADKLMARRDRMIVDLGLADEVPLLNVSGPGDSQTKEARGGARDQDSDSRSASSAW